jgi:hypothetical protein
MQLSLNEMQVECRKAARGAGLAWGLAEETGRAVAWLAQYGVDALPALLDCLRAVSVEDRSGDPIRGGTEMGDLAGKMGLGGVLSFAEIRQPILFLPFAALSARLINRPVTITHSDGAWLLTPEGADRSVLQEVARRSIVTAVTCRAGDMQPSAQQKSPPGMPRVEIDEAIWQRLQDLAHRTYVPASEQSRLLGAGAGTIDND